MGVRGVDFVVVNVADIDAAVRIRTGETDNDAL